ncbi:hypothetical protein [Conexibacter sp. SYSU D00693]|uniref:hypothetical protein n=1 Tax=Conexibacter sp. SYSU D00693 TaxID=2812560 RepID=UPI00196B5CF5|nr:hypothetical protein [Conexibacter sp. SYSU D00693]
MEPVKVARLVGAGRAAIGLGMLVAPRLAVGTWIGAPADTVGTQTVVRAFGARELLLGFLQSHVAAQPGVGRRTFAALSLCDLVDASVTIAGRKHLPASGVALVGVMAAAGGVSQLSLSRKLP